MTISTDNHVKQLENVDVEQQPVQALDVALKVLTHVETGVVITEWDSQKSLLEYQKYLSELDKYEGKIITASKAYFTDYLQGRLVQTTIGPVRISSKSKGKVFDKIRPAKLMAIPYIPEVLIHGDVSELRDLSKDRPDKIIGFYWFNKIIDIKNIKLDITLKVGQDNEGNLLYYMGTSKKQTPNSDYSMVDDKSKTKGQKLGLDALSINEGLSHIESTHLDSITTEYDDEINIEVQILDKDGNALSDADAEDLLFTTLDIKKSSAGAAFDGMHYTEAEVRRYYHLRSDIDKLAHQAATSPYNDLPEPTEEQKLSGDYPKGKIQLLGFDIHIENPAGSTRTGKDDQGNTWSNKMAHHYGYLADTLGADGDEVDVFVKSGTGSDFAGPVFVIDQINPDGSFDEHKVVLGVADEEEARDIYLSNYEKDWTGLGGLTEFGHDAFKEWLFSDKAQISLLFDGIGDGMLIDQLKQFDLEADPVGALDICLKILSKDHVIGELSDNHSDNYNDENYRYKDVGYIPNSRKELAQSSILQAKKDGSQLCVTDIDWDGLESEPRIAESLITKENVFGKVDWWALKDQGMNGNVAYFLKRLYTAVDKQPTDNTAEARRLYVTGIQNLRTMMEDAKTYDEVRDATISLSQLLKPIRNVITDENGAKDVSFDCKVMLALGKKLHSWIFKSGNKALHECKRMAVDDWSWLESKVKGESKPKTTRKERFQLEVASDIQRVGGQPVSIESTEQFKDLFGLAAVQSGKWVLNDKESAAWHITNAAASFMDMSDVTGIPVEQLGFGGRLGMAFGARGHGGALAHYEPDTRAINITKMRGGGSLGHEYFHFLDNVINEVMGQENVSIGSYGTRKPEALPNGAVRSAFEQLKNAMFDGNEVVVQYYPYGDREINWAKRNIESTYGSMAHHIKAASSLKDAAQAIDNAYRIKNGAKRPKNADSWVKIAAIYFNQYEGKEALIPTTRRGSDFYIKALDLDQQKVDSYWSSSHEMAARAFSAYLQDRLAEQQRQNDYLAYSTQGGNNRVGEVAYPQGEERQRVNAAFDALFKALRDEDVFGKAMSNQALMDSIFDRSIVLINEDDIEAVYS